MSRASLISLTFPIADHQYLFIHILLVTSYIVSSVSLSTGGLGIVDGRVHYSGKFMGEEASVPCEVDYDRCGHIYFLTWSKNVSNEWQRVYLYSESYQTALGDFAFGGGNRVNLDATNMTSTGVAYLKIKSVSLEDEGTFKCDVTYVHGSCPSLTYTQLFVLVTPGEPTIRVNGKDVIPVGTSPATFVTGLSSSGSSSLSSSSSSKNHSSSPSSSSSSATLGVTSSTGHVGQSTGSSSSVPSSKREITQVGPFTESSTIVLECTVSGGRPLPEVRWFNATRPIRSKISVSHDPEKGSTIISTARFIVTRYDLASVFSCRVSSNATIRPFVKWLSLDVHVKPLSLKVRGPVAPVVAGEMVSLTCSVDGARPRATIDWFNRSTLVDPQPASRDDPMSDTTFRTSSTLTFIAARYDHNRDFSCMGTNQVLKDKNEVPLLEVTSLKVLFPPECSVRLLPKDEPSSPSSSSSSDGLRRIECQAHSSPPVHKFTWTKYNKTISALDTEQRSSASSPLLSSSPSSSIIILEDSDLEAYSCTASNMMGTSPACRLEAHQITVSETEGNEARLPCQVDQAKCGKISYISWSRNSSKEWKNVYSYGGGESYQTALGDLSQDMSLDTSNISTSKNAFLRIKKVSPQDEATYRCLVTYQMGSSCPSLTYVRLLTMVTPGDPVIRVNGEEIVTRHVPLRMNVSSSNSQNNHHHNNHLDHQHQSQDSPADLSSQTLVPSRGEITRVGPFLEGSIVLLECETSGGRPTPHLTWFNGTEAIESESSASTPVDIRTPKHNMMKQEEHEVTSASSSSSSSEIVTATHRFIITRNDLASVFSCRVSNNATSEPLVRWISFDVHSPMLSESKESTGGVAAIDTDAMDNSLSVTPSTIPGTALNSTGTIHSSGSPSGWVQSLLKDENLIIITVAAGVLVFGLISSLIVTGVFVVRRRKLGAGKTGIGMDQMAVRRGSSSTGTMGNNNESNLNIFQSHHPHRSFLHHLNPLNPSSDHPSHHHYSRDVVNHMTSLNPSLSHKNPKESNKIASILEEERSRTPADSDFLTGIGDRLHHHHQVSSGLSSPLKSPLIRGAYNSISLRPDGSPLLSSEYSIQHDERSDGSESPTSTSSSIQHFYERPSQLESFSSNGSRSHLQHVMHNRSFHHLNIPLQPNPHHTTTILNNQHPSPLQPAVPPLPPERNYTHHSSSPHTRLEHLNRYGRTGMTSRQFMSPSVNREDHEDDLQPVVHHNYYYQTTANRHNNRRHHPNHDIPDNESIQQQHQQQAPLAHPAYLYSLPRHDVYRSFNRRDIQRPSRFTNDYRLA